MAVKINAHATAALKAVTYRITSTPTAQLPACAAQLAASIWTCREILSQPVDLLKGDGEAFIVANKFRNQLSALLQDRTVEGRWTAVVLLKSVIEAGGVEILSKSNTWVKNLLSILKKHDPPTTRSIAVLVLTRIFMLTWDYSNLVREITTPALPTFVLTCISNAEHKRCSKPELQTILESFEVLIPRHPTIFRTHEHRIRGLILRIISSTATDRRFSTEHVQTAQEILILLAQCAAKQGGAEKWNQTLENVIKATHQTCDSILRSVSEDWKPTSAVIQQREIRKEGGVEPSHDGEDVLGLSAWQGIFAGAARVETLLGLISSHFSTSSPAEVTLPIGMTMDLFVRLSSIKANGSESTPRNSQYSKEERDLLYSLLPEIHSATFDMASSMLEQLGLMASPMTSSILDHITGIFAVESFDTELRTTTYRLVIRVLDLIGSSLSSQEVADLSQIASRCCADLLPVNDNSSDSATMLKQQSTDLVLQTSRTETSNPTISSELQKAASDLLVILLSKIKPALMSRKIRTQLDRTAILTQHKEALLASILNPAPSPSGQGLQHSLLPLLAKLFPDDPAVESLLRPRMPYVIYYRKSGGDDVASDEDEDVEIDEGTVEQLDQHDGNTNELQTETMQDIAEEVADEAGDRSTKRHAEDNIIKQGNKKLRLDDAQNVPSTASKKAQELVANPFALNGSKKHTSSAFPKADSNDEEGDDNDQISAADKVITSNDLEDESEPVPNTTTTQRVEVSIPLTTSLDEDSDDGSDIEIPPLTMNSDSEDDA